jgi:hypothetical protein
MFLEDLVPFNEKLPNGLLIESVIDSSKVNPS